MAGIQRGKTDRLFDLISKLTPTEKRYIRVQTPTPENGKDSTYIRLFNFMASLDAYDEVAIRAHFDGEAMLNNLPKAKNSLYKLILKHLRNYHTNEGLYLKLQDLISNAEILYDKGLFAQARGMFDKAKKMARDIEDFPSIITIIRGANKCAVMQSDLSYFDEEFMNSYNHEIELLQNTVEYEKYYYQLFQQAKKMDRVRNIGERKIFDDFIRQPLLQNPEDAKSHYAQIYYHTIHIKYNYLVFDWEAHYEHSKTLIALFEGLPSLTRHELRKYLSTLVGWLTSLTELQRHQEFEEVILKIRAAPERFQLRENYAWLNYVLYETDSREMALYLKSGMFDRAYEMIPKMEDWLVKLGRLKNVEIITSYHIFHTYFGIGRFGDSLDWLNRVMDVATDLREDLGCFTRIINILLHFELGHQSLIEYQVKNAYRYISKRKRLYRFEKMVLDVIRRNLPKTTDPKELKDTFQRWRSMVMELIEDPFETQSLDYFDFIAWLDSKITSRPYGEMVQLRRKDALQEVAE